MNNSSSLTADDDWNFEGTIKASRITQGRPKTDKPILNIPPPPKVPATGWKSLKIIVDGTKSTLQEKKSVFEAQAVNFESLGKSSDTLNQGENQNYIDTIVTPTLMKFKDRIRNDHMDNLTQVLEAIDLESPGLVKEILLSFK